MKEEKYYVICNDFLLPTLFAADGPGENEQHWTTSRTEARHYETMEELAKAPYANIPGTWPLGITRFTFSKI